MEPSTALISVTTPSNSAVIPEDAFKDNAVDIVSLLVAGGLVPTRSEGRRAVEQNGVSVNGEKVTDPRTSYTRDDIGEGLVLQKGKKSFKKMLL